MLAEARLERAEEERVKQELEFRMTRKHFQKCEIMLAAGEEAQKAKVASLEARLQVSAPQLWPSALETFSFTLC